MKANIGIKRAEKPNGRRDEGGPLVAAVQAEASRHPLGFCEDSPLRDASSDSPAGSKGRRPSKSKLFPPAGAGVGGGENTVQALLWNVGTCHPDAKGAIYPSKNDTWSGCLSKSLWSHIRICSRHDLKSRCHFGTGIQVEAPQVSEYRSGVQGRSNP